MTCVSVTDEGRQESISSNLRTPPYHYCPLKEFFLMTWSVIYSGTFVFPCYWIYFRFQMMNCSFFCQFVLQLTSLRVILENKRNSQLLTQAKTPTSQRKIHAKLALPFCNNIALHFLLILFMELNYCAQRMVRISKTF